MASNIAFAYTPSDCHFLGKYYADSSLVRIPLFRAQTLVNSLPRGPALWIDPSMDAFDRWPPRDDVLTNFFGQFPETETIGNRAFQRKPEKSLVSSFTHSVLNACQLKRPDWISVPQLPMVKGGERNRINYQFAEATADWKKSSGFAGKVILPAVITNQQQINLKTQRNAKISFLKNCFKRANPDGVWIVESSLWDQSGSPTYGATRFGGLVDFHAETLDALERPRIVVAGPYWGMNLVLWARGLATHPAIGLGRGYRYFVPYAKPKEGKTRVAIGPLRRTVVLEPELEAWLKEASARTPTGSKEHQDLQILMNEASRLYLGTASRHQIARFYKEWFDAIDRVRDDGRPLALFQDLSAAFVYGKSLPSLPRNAAPGRRPERVAEQLMLFAV